MRRTVVVALCLVLACGSGESVLSIEIGQCFNGQQTEEISSVPVVDCSEPHDNEVFALGEFPDSEAPYPSHDVLVDYGFNVCVVQFEAYVGLSYADSELDVFPIAPTEESWNNNDRDVVCALYALDSSKLTGSMRGAAR